MNAPSDKPRKTRGDGRVAFLARLSEISAQLTAGHTQKSIYDTYADQLGILYPQFGKYVRKYLTGKTKVDEHQRKDPAQSRPVATSSGQSVAVPAPGGPATVVQPVVPSTGTGSSKPVPGAGNRGRKVPFQYDPTKLDRDELI